VVVASFVEYLVTGGGRVPRLILKEGEKRLPKKTDLRREKGGTKSRGKFPYRIFRLKKKGYGLGPEQMKNMGHVKGRRKTIDGPYLGKKELNLQKSDDGENFEKEKHGPE